MQWGLLWRAKTWSVSFIYWTCHLFSYWSKRRRHSRWCSGTYDFYFFFNRRSKAWKAPIRTPNTRYNDRSASKNNCLQALNRSCDILFCLFALDLRVLRGIKQWAPVLPGTGSRSAIRPTTSSPEHISRRCSSRAIVRAFYGKGARRLLLLPLFSLLTSKRGAGIFDCVRLRIYWKHSDYALSEVELSCSFGILWT